MTGPSNASPEVRLEILRQKDEALTDLLRAYYFRRINGPLNLCQQISSCVGDCPQNHQADPGEPLFYSGAGFDLGNDHLAQDSGSFTENDLLRMAQLSVPVSGACVSDYFGGYFDRKLEDFNHHSLNDLLELVSIENSLDGLSDVAFEEHLGRTSPAQQLWSALRSSSVERRWGLGPTRVSKLIAVKRPKLIPIYDKWVREAFGRKNDTLHWIDMRDLFQTDPSLSARLQQLPTSDFPPISTIRILDVLLWMNGVKARAMNEEGALYKLSV